MKDESQRPQTASCRTIALLSLLLAIGCSSPTEPPKPKKKNVILITLDALRQDHLSAFGYTRQTSPNIDWLALNGVSFRTVVTTGCAPRVAMTSLFTSQPFSWAQLQNGTTLSESSTTMAEAFAAGGYQTAGFVASPVLARETGFGQGFEKYVDFADGPADYVTADVAVQAAIDHLKARAADAPPFFLYVSLLEPHPPWKHASPWLTSAEASNSFFDQSCTYIPTGDEIALLGTDQKEHLIAKYDGALRFADEQIGNLIKHLRTSGQLGNTIIAVTTDYGFELLDRFSVSHDYNPFDEVVRIPLVIFDQTTSFKDAIPKAVQARIFDVGPTLMGLAGVAFPAGVEGIDLLNRAQDVPELAFVHCTDADVVRSLEYKLIDFDLAPVRQRVRQMPEGLEDGVKFYALRSDPREELDAQGSGGEHLQKMQGALASFRSALGREPMHLAESGAGVAPKTRERLRVLGYDSAVASAGTK
jgi:arylsulfatase A-like enzyme